MKKCSFCAQANPDDAALCQFCRSPLTQTAKKSGPQIPAGSPKPPAAEASPVRAPAGLPTPPAAAAPLPPAPLSPAARGLRWGILTVLLFVLGYLVLRPLYLSLAAAKAAECRRLSDKKYIEGRLAFAIGRYGQARQLWTAALVADPKNKFARQGLQRLEKTPPKK